MTDFYLTTLYTMSKNLTNHTRSKTQPKTTQNPLKKSKFLKIIAKNEGWLYL